MATTLDPSDYRGRLVDGKVFRRVARVIVNNPYQGTPTLVFDEEEVQLVDGVLQARHIELLSTNYVPATSIPLRSPATGDLTGGNMTMQQLYVALYSLYRYLAAQRDAQTP